MRAGRPGGNRFSTSPRFSRGRTRAWVKLLADPSRQSRVAYRYARRCSLEVPRAFSPLVASGPGADLGSPVPPTTIAVIGAGFIAEVHLESYRRFVPDARVVAVCSRTRERAEAMAARHHVPHVFTDVDDALAQSDCEVVDICVPNFLHAEMCLAAAAAGGQARDRREAARDDPRAGRRDDRGLRQAGVKLMYAEELCFAPKYERVRRAGRRGRARPDLHAPPVREAPARTATGSTTSIDPAAAC